MKSQSSKVIFLILFCLVLGINNATLAKNQVDPIIEVEKDNCNRTVEVNYRSQKLISSDGNTTVYFEGILRRVGKNGDRSNEGYCLPSLERQTPVTMMIIENQGNVKRISFKAEDLYLTVTPISFSPNMRYLVLEKQYGFNGGDGATYHLMIDTKDNYKQLSATACNDDYEFSGEYRGFISDLEVLLNCSPSGGSEVFDLQGNTVRKVSESFAKSVKTTKLYGTISGQITILKRQVFPLRR